MKTATKASSGHFDKDVKLAGGMGLSAAVQDAEALLRRSVMTCLLWEDNAYQDGVSVAEEIKKLIPQVDPTVVAAIAVESRFAQKLRHVPLFIAREMARHDSHKKLLGDLLPTIIRRADELTEFVNLYWKDGKVPLANQVKQGLAKAFNNFDEYQLSKYSAFDKSVKLRDVMFLVHPTPAVGKDDLFKRLANNELATPDTWEVALSTGQDKVETWTRLIKTNKLGAMAFLRNLRNMENSGVPDEVIKLGFDTINPKWLLPLNFFAAAAHAPRWQKEIEVLMLKSFSKMPQLFGHTLVIVDVSGSMMTSISAKSQFRRIDVGGAMATLANSICEKTTLYVTAGGGGWSFSGRGGSQHKTKKLEKTGKGFEIAKSIIGSYNEMGGGGIYTRQCLDYIKKEMKGEIPDRIFIFTDSQDCDTVNKLPQPFGKKNYIIDVASHTRGVGYKGVWTAEISGWSEHVFSFIAAFEGHELVQTEDE